LPVLGLALLGGGLRGKRVKSRRALSGIFLLVLFTATMSLPACSSGKTTTTTTGTPAGTYIITVSGASGGATRPSVVALVVQ
jgi:hypothetical protein